MIHADYGWEFRVFNGHKFGSIISMIQVMLYLIQLILQSSIAWILVS